MGCGVDGAGLVTPPPESPPTEDAALAAVLTRIEVKLDAALLRGDDHEARLRVVEAREYVTPRGMWLVATGGIAGAVGIAQLVNHLVTAAASGG